MPTRRRRPAGRTRSPYRRRRHRTTASTLGTAAGAALAALLAALVGGLPWWGWVLIVVVGLAAGLAWAVHRGRALEASDPPAPPAAG